MKKLNEINFLLTKISVTKQKNIFIIYLCKKNHIRLRYKFKSLNFYFILFKKKKIRAVCFSLFII